MNFNFLFSCMLLCSITVPSLFSMEKPQTTFAQDFCEIFTPQNPTDRMHTINASVKQICGRSIFKEIAIALNQCDRETFKGSTILIIKKMKAIIGAIALEYHATILQQKSVESLAIASLSTLIDEFKDFVNNQAFYQPSNQKS